MIVPMGISLYYSFCDYNILTPASIFRAKNYIKMFTDDEVWRKEHSGHFLFCPCFCSAPSDLCIDRCHAAFKDNEGNRLLPCSLLSSIDHRRLCSSSRSVEGSGATNGVINTLLNTIGIKTSFAWLGNTKTAIWMLIILAVWQFGFFHADLLVLPETDPTSLYEAANIDGANGWHSFWRITLPLLTPTIFFNLVMQMINGFLAFTQCFIITGGAPMNSTLFYTVYMYQQSFEFYNTGYGAAMAWVMLMIIGLVTLVLFATKTVGIRWRSVEHEEKRLIGKIIYHVLVCGLGLVMIYPLVWMIMSSFKPTSTIFTTAGQLIPTQFVFENYVNGWKGFAKITFATFSRIPCLFRL